MVRLKPLLPSHPSTNSPLAQDGHMDSTLMGQGINSTHGGRCCKVTWQGLWMYNPIRESKNPIYHLYLGCSLSEPLFPHQ